VGSTPYAGTPLAHRLLTGFPVGSNQTTETRGESEMFTTNGILATAAIAALLIVGGCSTAGALRPAEVRVATQLEAGSPKLVVLGPARLLHVDVHGRQPLELYRVRRGGEGTVSCLDSARTSIRLLRQRASTELNLVVEAGEAICLTAGGAGAWRDADVSWHARSGAAAPVETAHASNF
jgi:hypothetical protein